MARPVYEQFCELNEESNDLSWFHGDDAHESVGCCCCCLSLYV